MSKNLVIVESPAKAKKIGPYLGKDFEVMASVGHVRDLPKKGMSIDIEHGFEPTYEVNTDKKKVVADLKKAAKTAGHVWLASDPDREGEAIAWHLYEAIGLKADNTKRIVFREITESAVKNAIANPRDIDKNLVDAQQARRVLDRLVGYELSPVLWKKVRPGLSAGRVQSVAVRLIVEREREIEAHSAKPSFKVSAIFTADGTEFKAELGRKLPTEAEAKEFLEACKGASFTVANLEKKPGKRSPAAPFTTSTLQQEASRKLGFSVRQTMTVAQRLYEAGLITYMRTDSVNLSETALSAAGSYITKTYGANYAKRRTYTTRAAGAQEAHEAIRPTEIDRTEGGEDSGQQRLYQLIWQRTVASQMAEAALERTTIDIAISTLGDQLTAKGEVITFDGFMKVYLEGRDEPDEETSGLLPTVTVGQDLPLLRMTAVQGFDRHKPRYTEASLVKKLEELGIGRPSTYAPTISTIQDRGYAEKGDTPGTPQEAVTLTLEKDIERTTATEMVGADRNKLFPTPIGTLVTDFLVKHFPDVVDYDFTASVEQEFDEIEAGKKAWNKMIAEFYKDFHKTVQSSESISREEASGARELGKDPKTGKPVIARMGRYGPMIQIGHAEDDEKPQFAPLPPDTKIETVTLDEAMEMFKLPRSLGKTEAGEDIEANFGRFGPYIKFGKLYVSIKPDDPFSITPERAQELIAQKLKTEAEKHIKTFEGTKVQILNGPYGPYVTDGTKNARIPKGTEPESLTLEQCQDLLAKAPAKGARRGRARRAAK